MDLDEVGIRAVAEITKLFNAAKVVRVPMGKDMNEAYLLIYAFYEMSVSSCIVLGYNCNNFQ
jgi:hypothetical protein